VRSALARARHFGAEVWDEWRHSLGVNALATVTVAGIVFAGGVALLAVSNVERHVRTLRADARVVVYLRDDAPEPVHRQWAEELRGLPGIARVDYVDKAAALERYRAVYGELAGLAGELESNPLPASLEAVLLPGADARRAARDIETRFAGRPGVEEVRFDGDWLDRLDRMLAAAKKGGLLVAVVSLAAVVLVTGSVLRLAVLAHAEEVEIMLLVGASPWFVRAPFLIAGAVQGALASGIALSALEAARRLALAASPDLVQGLLRLVAGSPLPFARATALAGAGILAAAGSALVACRRP